MHVCEHGIPFGQPCQPCDDARCKDCGAEHGDPCEVGCECTDCQNAGERNDRTYADSVDSGCGFENMRLERDR